MGWLVAMIMMALTSCLVPAGIWTRDALGTISPSSVWEGGAVMEPAATWDVDAKLWRLYYTANEAAGGLIGYAIAPTLQGPWSKAGPVVGLSHGGLAGTAAQSFVVRSGTGFVMYVSSLDAGVDRLQILTSPDGYNWSLRGPGASLPAGYTHWGNKHVWRDATGWHALFEAGTYPPAEQWHVFRWASPDGFTWAQVGGPYRSLAVSTAALTTEGGVFLLTHQAPYVLFFHAGTPSGPAGPQQIGIYMATSNDLAADNWKVTGPLLRPSGVGFEINGIGDPHVFRENGKLWMLYDGEDDANLRASIGLAYLGPG